MLRAPLGLEDWEDFEDIDLRELVDLWVGPRL